MGYLFKKKKEVVDFRPKDSDMPIPAKMRDRLLSGKGNTGIVTSADPSTNSSSSTSSGSSGSGGFFSFFGGSDSSSSNSSSSNTSSSSSGSFWDAGTNTSSSSSSSSYNSGTTLEKLETSLNDLLYRFSRLVDRVELLEKKMDRVERKDGSGGY